MLAHRETGNSRHRTSSSPQETRRHNRAIISRQSVVLDGTALLSCMDIANLIKKATTPAKNEVTHVVDDAILTAIKTVCKKNPTAVKEAFYYLSTDLTKRNGAVRIRALLVMDCLLHRSKVFRELVCADIRTIVGNMGLLKEQGSSSSSTFTAATSLAAEVQAKGKELVEVWDHLYGERYPQLRAVSRYLREVLRLEMPNILENARQHVARSERHVEHSRRAVLLQKDQILRTEWSFHMGEWRRSVERLREMFALLFPRIGDDAPQPPPPGALHAQPAVLNASSVDGAGGLDEDGDDLVNWVDADDEAEGVGATAESPSADDSTWTFDQASAGNATYTLNIRLSTAAADVETPENAVLVQQVREIAKHLVRAAVPTLRQWRAIFARAAEIYAAERAQEGDASASAVGGEEGIPRSDPASSSSSSASRIGSLLGKRAAEASDQATAEPLGTSSGSSAAWIAESTVGAAGSDAAERCVQEIDALLGEIRELITSKVQPLLQGEAL